MPKKIADKSKTAGSLKLSAAYRMLDVILEAAKIRGSIVDKKFNLVFVDRLTRKGLGAVKGRLCFEYFRGRAKPCRGCLIRAAARKRNSHSTEIYNEKEKKWKRITVVPFTGSDGRELFSEIKVDISADVRAREIFETLSRGYEDREERYKVLFGSANIAWIVAEAASGIIVDANFAAERLTGRTRQELIGIDRIKLHPPEKEGLYRQQFKKHVALGDIQAAEAVVLRKDGGRVPVEISDVRTDSGGKKYIQGLFVDISKRKAAEESLLRYQAGLEETVRKRTADLKAANDGLVAKSSELENAILAAEQTSRLKSDFIASMSHELGTPLNAINGFSSVLLKEKYGKMNEKQREYADIIQKSAQLLISLVDEALDLSRIEAGKFELEKKEFDLSQLIEGTLNLFREKALEHGISLSTELSKSLLVRADKNKITQVVLNLLSNALKFTQDGGMIGVKTEVISTEAVVSVWDNGVEIKEEDRERIFNKFAQLKDPQSRNTGGSGLGLVISKRLVELHGGRMWLESGGKAKRTVFVFSLPA